MTSHASPLASVDRAYAFGPFIVDSVRRILRRDGQPVRVTSRAFDVLILLIEQRGRIVPKEEILATIWGDTIVEENNLFRHISRIRKALEDRPDEPRYVVTIPSEGYRFVARVTELDDLSHDALPWPGQDVSPQLQDQPLQDEQAESPIRSETRAWFDRIGQPVRAYPFWIAAGLAIATLAAATFTLFPALKRAAPGLGTPVLSQITFDAGFPREATWSPDGHAFAYTSDRAGNPDIWIRNLGEQNPIQVTRSPAAESAPSWSADGRWLAYRSTRDEGGLYVAPVTGGTERRIAEFGDRPQWSPDGSLVLFTWRAGGALGPLGIYVVGMDGQPPRQVRPDLAKQMDAAAAAWHPDGRVSIVGLDKGAPVMLTAPLDGGPAVKALDSEAFRRRVDSLGLRLGAFVWSRSGDHLFFEGTAGVDNLWRVTVDPATNLVSSGPDRLTVGPGADTHVAVSPDGQRLLFGIRPSRTQLWSYPFDPVQGRLVGAGKALTSGSPGELDVDAAADGSKFAYRVRRGNQHEVWEHSLASGRDRLLFKGTGGDFSKPIWSPDSRQLVFSRRWTSSSSAPSRVELIVLSSGDGRARVIPVSGQILFQPSDWAAEGRTILGACQRRVDEPVKLCATTVSETVMAASVTEVASDAARDLWNGHFSPDQRWIVFQALDRTEQGTSTIFTIPAGGGGWTAASSARAFEDKPHWSPDGRTIYFMSDRGGWMNVWGQRFSPEGGRPLGDPFRVTSLVSEQQMISTNLRAMEFAVATNRLILPITASSGQVWMLEHPDW